MKRTIATLSLALLAALAVAQSAPPGGKPRDDGGKPPVAPAPASVDTSPRCQSSAVNSCRSGCETRRFEVPAAVLVRKREECKQDCVRGC